jgi:hypothetical protein
MRRSRFLISVVVIVACVAGACGGNKATPLETVRGASSATASAQTAAMSLKIEGGAGALANLTMNGAFDFDKHLGNLKFDGSKMGLSGSVEAIMDFRDGVLEYMKIPGLAQELDGKHWVKLDVGAAIKSLCPDLDFASLLQAQSGDPTSGLQQLETADKVTVIGKEKVRGEQTTHYGVDVNLAKVVDSMPADARETMRQLAAFYVDPVQHADVWLDGDGRARRVRQTIDAANMKLPACLSKTSAQSPFQGKTTITTEMYDFGKEVEVSIPVANDTADFQELMQQAG